MPMIIGHTITVWCSRVVAPIRDENGFLTIDSVVSRVAEGERLIDHLRELWINVDRPNHSKHFQPGPVLGHVNGWGSFTVTFIAHEGDMYIVEGILKETRTWTYDDGSTSIRIQHAEWDLEGEQNYEDP